MSSYSAMILGATGLVGKELLRLLLSTTYYDQIMVVSRRELEISDPRLKVILLEDFDQLQTLQDQLIADDYYCVLGTTIKKAGSKERFKKVDLDYPVQMAQIARQSPAFVQYLIVTAAGASPRSPLFYNRVKGQVEEELRQMNLPALKIFRPSLLLGDREEFRLGEEAAKVISRIFSFFMVGLNKRFWSIKASDVAQAMFMTARRRQPGGAVIRSNDMLKMVNLQGL